MSVTAVAVLSGGWSPGVRSGVGNTIFCPTGVRQSIHSRGGFAVKWIDRAASVRPVTAPLAPDFAESVLWQEQAPAAPALLPTWRRRPPSAWAPARPDVVVVGAGYAGVSAAPSWRPPGARCSSMTPDRLGRLARGGGMVIPELTSGPAALAKSLGPLGLPAPR